MARYLSQDSAEAIAQAVAIWVPLQGMQVRVSFEVPSAMRVRVRRKLGEYPRDETDGVGVLDQSFPGAISFEVLDTSLPVPPLGVATWYYRVFSADDARFNELTSRTALVHAAGYYADLLLRQGYIPQAALAYDPQLRELTEILDSDQGLVNPGLVAQELGAMARILISMAPALDQVTAHMRSVEVSGADILTSSPEVLEQISKSLGFDALVSDDVGYQRALTLSLAWIFKRVGTTDLIVWLGKFALNGYVPHVQEMSCVPYTFANPATWEAYESGD